MKANSSSIDQSNLPNKKLINLKQLLVNNPNCIPQVIQNADHSSIRPSHLLNLTKTEVKGKFDLMVIEKSVKLKNEVSFINFI